MRLSAILSLGFSALALAAPTSNEKRAAAASVSDTPAFGYATQNGGTTGGNGGTTTTVTTFDQLTAAVAGDQAAIVVIGSSITATGNVKIGSNKTVLGKTAGITLTGFTLTVKNAKNVIIRNLAIKKVIGGDSVAVQVSNNVWLDHLDLSSDRDHDKDYYDGLMDLTHAADFVTVSYVKFHDHWKASLIGHSDNNGAQDTGHLRVTYGYNHWVNINSRGPSLRFGTGHIFSSYYDGVSDGINTRDGAQVLVENNVFVGSNNPLYSTDSGYAVATGNDFGAGSNQALAGTLTSVPYTYPKTAASGVKAAVVGIAGNTLSF